MADRRHEKPHIRLLRGTRGGWLCEGGNLGGTGWTPQRAYRAWLWNMVHNATDEMRARFGLSEQL